MKPTTKIVVLAAGKSTRMNGHTQGQPKVLLPVGGEPMIKLLLRTVANSGIDPRPVIVVGPGGEVRKSLGENYDYIVQEEARGTAHAVQCAEFLFQGVQSVIVLYGDMPFIKGNTLRFLEIVQKENKKSVLTMATITVPDFEGPRKALLSFGRVIRDAADDVQKIVEVKDADEEQLLVREVNPSFFCFDAAWLRKSLSKITAKNAQHEYYLTDLAGIAAAKGFSIATITADPEEAIGVNTPEELKIAEELAGK